ncbi:MAG: hypothetical protein COA99_16515 [Moraxellaceae bacterium]|nr:MAG: hypothetical protein COA99_16515 [Moraxellaceae bacterium]
MLSVAYGQSEASGIVAGEEVDAGPGLVMPEIAPKALAADKKSGNGAEEVAEDVAAKNKDRNILTPYWEKSAYWLEGSRDDWSEKVDWMARNIDRFFAGKETLEFGNRSYIRLQVGGTLTQGGAHDNDSDVKFRLHLPATERRFSVVIENISEDKESLEQKARPSLAQDNSLEDSTVTAALEFVRTKTKFWNIKSLVGVEAKLPGDIFTKFTAKRRWELGDSWTMPYRIKIAYYVVDSWEIEHSLAFEKPLKDDLFFSAITSAEWAEEDDSTLESQIFSFRKRLDDTSGIDYRIGFLSQNVDNIRLTSSFLSAHYRKLLYKDWLYYNLIPEFNFARSNDFHSEFSLTLRLEVFFQK